ncbi:hypothetical protein [Rhizobium sp. RU36D]|uniref:hypothetical protein n=1 Tax=Rhizobium sp. RU36D TaxID=1907415 RepID=UPI0009D7E373|nr:hypothetical protein [Rhizobium sp. RU36D]SMD16424.1 hypothetical protein SAMN05880593_12985 [Rhizobium sp. RU36D]
MAQELDDHLKAVKAEAKKRERDNVVNTSISALIGAGLAYWAWSTIAHAAFGFALFFAISAIGNRVTDELFRARTQQKTREIMDREERQSQDSPYDVERGKGAKLP